MNFSGLSKNKLINIVNESTMFPITETIGPSTNNNLSTIYYTCEHDKCTVLDAIQSIKYNADLKAIGCKDIVNSTATVIAENPDTFNASRLDGFIFKLGNERVFHIKNNSSPPPLSGRTAVIHLSELKQQAIYEKECSTNFWNRFFLGTFTASFLYMAHTYRFKRIP